MTRFDRFLAREYVLFSLLGLVTVVVLYDLINLIERMSYFLRYKTDVLNLLLYYVYDLPAATGLLLPVGFALGVFLVIGRLIRSNELLPLLASGVNIFRLFVVFLAISLAASIFLFAGNEFVATRARTRFLLHRSEAIEKRSRTRTSAFAEVKYISKNDLVYYIGQLRTQDSTARQWIIAERDQTQRMRRRIYVPLARYTPKGEWEAENVEVREFRGDEELYLTYPKMTLRDVSESPEELGAKNMETEEMSLGQLRTYINRMSAAGSNVAQDSVEYHFRFSSPLTVVIVSLISLSAATLLRKRNITLGIGLGLLVSFVYWGVIQASRALGYAGNLPPWLAAWMPNILFFTISGVLLTKVKR